MANSAQYLLQLFNEEPREEGETFDLRRVMLAVGDVDRQLNGLIALGVSRFEAYRKGMPELWEKAWRTFQNATNVNAYVFTPISARELSFGVAGMLRDIRDNCLTLDMSLDDERKKSIGDMLSAVVSAVNGDTTLPPALKSYVVKLAHEVRLAMDLAETGTEFELSDALSRLMESLNVAEAMSKDKTIWQRLREKTINPFTVAFFSAAGSYMLGVATGQYQLPW